MVESKWWDKRKADLLEGLDETLASCTVDRDVLELMKELVTTSKIRTRITDYYDDKED